ncbi:polysaccharide deacetylase family protein [Geobacter pelophilus]|uniref:Polysaccharide deacetylase family protein n=2 Tax=Geoanaerobacter pelophilus TaxID=60036 RepID=A0AAW4L6A8_9BACT|nr:polysaccharide deacetylase family protein [Geoanaerobacter pelophilus]
MNRAPNADERLFNALTIDVEEWFHVCGAAGIDGLTLERRLRRNIERLLAVLDAGQVKATFFVLGSLAAAEPEVVKEIAGRGHEIASHGYSHALVHSLTPDAFRDELRRTADILGQLTGCRPRGFRAPQWSLSRDRTPWAFDILLAEGYHYDSSCTPLPFIGNKHGQRIPWRIELDHGTLWEIPPLVTPSWIGNLPTGGGWGFRFFPMPMIERTIVNLNSLGAPGVFFLHPRELDPDGPRLKMSRFREFVAYGSRKDAMERLKRLLAGFRFTTLGKMVQQWESA